MFGQALNTPILAQSLQRLFDQSLARLITHALASAQAHHVVSTGHLRFVTPRGLTALPGCPPGRGSAATAVVS